MLKETETTSNKRRNLMYRIKVKRVIALALLLAVLGLALPYMPAARAGNENKNAPDLPLPLCDDVQVPAGNKLAFHTYAVGVQKYRWNGTSWTFVEPVATLYADANYHGKVGSHYAGPTWESNSGSKVIAARVAGCTPDPTAIAWLRLQTVTADGPGIFGSITYIQRVNTVGGLAPVAPGSAIGQVVEVPYTAEYYFYREGY
jgi:FtsP/CotA-like multicopper oxidase with cupredoxin domain